MARKMVQFRDPALSVWQSAVDEVVSKSKSGGAALDVNSPAPAARPDPSDPMVAAGDAIAAHVEQTGQAPDLARPQVAAAGVFDNVRFCSSTAFKLAVARIRGNNAEADRLEKELTVQMGPCDARWLDVVRVFLKHFGGGIPYRRYALMNDFVIDGRLPAQARVAILADWGTGDDGAKLLLRQIAEKKPDVVLHLGDVYYSGTQHEFQNYFYKIWQPTFGIEQVAWGGKPKAPTKPATFTLSGNHDMYAGGAPYYTTIDMLGQPASYFCLRNDDWQFLAIDTGLHDSNPVDRGETFLEDAELAWLKDKIANAGNRKTVLLSHHQLFSAFEDIDKSKINGKLLAQLGDVLDKVTVWLWGHEHNLIIYDIFQGVLARCIGHGAFPVGVDEVSKPDPNVPIQKIALAPEQDGALFQHGYVIMDLNGANAKATYYQFDAETQEEEVLHEETYGAQRQGAGRD